VDRRTFVKGAVVSAGAAVAVPGVARASTANIALPSNGLVTRPARTPVEHLVVLVQENRSLNHTLGWYGSENKAFDGRQKGTFRDLRQGPTGPLVSTEPWGERGRKNYHGRAFADPSHGWSGGRLERNGGRCDGWLDPGTGNDEFCLSTYDAVDVPVWARLVRDYQAYDRWFASLLGPTQPNRFYLHSAQSGGLKNNDLPPQHYDEHPEWVHGYDWPTIWTLCKAYGVSATYYYSNLPQIAYWGERHLEHARPIAEYYADAAAGTLPQLAIVDPWYTAPEGLANDDHPHADIRLGQAFISDVVEAFGSSPCYQKGALVVTQDEWGGFWDHVNPPRLADDRGTPNDPGGPEDFGQLGFRIPSAIMSPWTRTPPGKLSRVDHTVYEHCSILKFVSDNWGLPYLTARHGATNSLEKAFRRFESFNPDPSYVPYPDRPDLLLEPTLEDPMRNPEAVVGLLPIDAPDLPASSAPALTEGSDLHVLASMGWFDGLPVNTDLRFEDSYLRSRPNLLAAAGAALV
jgi:phospholipase C